MYKGKCWPEISRFVRGFGCKIYCSNYYYMPVVHTVFYLGMLAMQNVIMFSMYALLQYLCSRISFRTMIIIIGPTANINYNNGRGWGEDACACGIL